MPLSRLARFALLPELFLKKMWQERGTCWFEAEKTSDFEVCPKCAKACSGVYDRRIVTLRDRPLDGRLVQIRIRKRRFWCRDCKKPFTEPLNGVSKGQRTTQRYRKYLLWACETFCDLKRVREHMRCSYGLVYKALYEQLDLELRKRKYPWPKSIGIDEHKFKRDPRGGWPIFATAVVDHTNKRLYELVEGRTQDDLFDGLHAIPGRENVQLVTMDLCQPFRKFVSGFFPNAKIVADKFHVVRLLHPAINAQRKKVAGHWRKNPIGRLLIKDSRKLQFHERRAIWAWLAHHADMKELYEAKEAMHSFYRIKGYDKAAKALTKLCDHLGQSKLKPLKTLRRTLMIWRKEILNYFNHRITNGRTEGYNGKAKLVKRKAYGYRSFTNYRLRVLNACT